MFAFVGFLPCKRDAPANEQEGQTGNQQSPHAPHKLARTLAQVAQPQQGESLLGEPFAIVRVGFSISRQCQRNLAQIYAVHAACSRDRREMKMTKTPPANLSDWVEFCWLLLVDPTFQATRAKRKAYFEYRLGKLYTTPFC